MAHDVWNENVKGYDPEDPMEFVGIPVTGIPEELMIEAFIEEYARFGMEENEIFRLFQNPVYAGTHHFFKRAGEPATRQLIQSVIRRTGVFKFTQKGRTCPR